MTTIKLVSSQPVDAPREGWSKEDVRALRFVGGTLTVIAILLTGAIAGCLVDSSAPGKPETGGAMAAQEAPQPEKFVYFPSQYVNQATEVQPHIEAF